MRAQFVFEKFIEKSDPVADMGIGVDPKREAKKFMKWAYGDIRKIAQRYYGDPNWEGVGYVVHGFFRNILEKGEQPQDAFYHSCENENYYGDDKMSVDIRNKLANSIYKYHYIKVDPNDPRL